MKEGVKVSDDAMSVYCRIPTKNGCIHLKSDLEEWEPSEGAAFSLVFEELDDYFALTLRAIFLSAYVKNLATAAHVSFSFRFNQISSEALVLLFKEAERKFPEKMQFICASEGMLDAWIEALAHAVIRNRLSENTSFDLRVGRLSEAQQSTLQTALSFASAPEHLVIIYHDVNGNLAELNSSVLKLTATDEQENTSLSHLVSVLQAPAMLTSTASSVAMLPASAAHHTMWSQKKNTVPPQTRRFEHLREDTSSRMPAIGRGIFSIAEGDEAAEVHDEEEKYGCN